MLYFYIFTSEVFETAIATKSDKKIYYQVSASILDEETRTRELRPLQADNALGQKIYASISNFITKPMYDVKLKGIDDLGNKVEFYVSRGDKEGALFKIENIIDGNLNEKAKTLTLTPYAAKFPDKSGEMNGEYKQVGDKFTIDLSLLK